MKKNLLILTLLILAASCNEKTIVKNKSVLQEIDKNGQTYINSELKSFDDIEKIEHLKLIKIDTVTQKELAGNYLSYLDGKAFEYLQNATPTNKLLDSAKLIDQKIEIIRQKRKSYDSIKFRYFSASYDTKIVKKNKTTESDTITLIFDKDGYVANSIEVINNSKKEFN